MEKEVIPLILPPATTRDLSPLLSKYQDQAQTWEEKGKITLLNHLQSRYEVPPPVKPPVPQTQQLEVPAAKGYVFISYSSQDKDFIEQFKEILKRRNYGYWDYGESQRDYHSPLYRELEERIEQAVAFICIVSDSWRESEWPGAEYIYAREAKIPVFVLQAKPLKRPMPIVLNQQTRIDFTQDFKAAAVVLEKELDRKGL